MKIIILTIFSFRSGYVGSIQSHFQKNAEKHPDRQCVIETASSKGPERSFTYGQIYRASNILAHRLHDAGITNGDTVMIWAHRSVDLVVAFMGTLVSLRDRDPITLRVSHILIWLFLFDARPLPPHLVF